ncbi:MULTISPECIES: NAD(P)-binding domain-containing protein [unclassified Halomonas]|uniref:NADPH-dependent F420 reductase n=1 Tax=unclassified Halomonas TaxID=2609666 RepID=UPI00207687B9|nr:NAD(P)-binding domain-containing protein [Halomonas sp. S3-1-8]
MKIGILGSGMMGGTLGTIWAAEGHEVTFSYSRQASKLERLAQATGAHYGTPAEAARNADVVLLAVHWSRIDDVLAQAGDLSGKCVVNCCVPLDSDNRYLVVGTSTSGAEELAKRLPNVHFVSAFNTTPSEALIEVFQRRTATVTKPDVLYYGDDSTAKRMVETLIDAAGYQPLDAGALETARFVEPFAMVTAELAYNQPGKPSLVYRFDRL